jgi:hypothetical protein
MLIILIITYICGVFVTGFILSMLSILSNLSRLEWRVVTTICMIMWPVIWMLLWLGITLVIVGYVVYSVCKWAGNVFNMRSE